MSVYGAPPGGASPYAGPPGYPGRPGYGPGATQPRETGALITCVALLVVAVVGCIIAAFSINNDSAATASPVPVAPGSYAPGSYPTGGVAPGGGVSTYPTAPSTPTDPGRSLARRFPIYPGAQRITREGRYLPRGATTDNRGRAYLIRHSATSVYRWYYRRLASGIPYNWSPSNVTDSQTGKIIDSFSSISSPRSVTLNGNFNIQTGRNSRTCVITVVLYA